MNSSRIVIIGGGFAGVKCAKTLRKSLPRDQYEIAIFNRENHMVFHPLLAEVAGASVNPDAVAAPLRQMLPHVSCRTEAVQRIDLDHNYVEYESHDGQMRQMAYDHVVIACGGAVNLGMVPGMADHAFPLKTIGDAIALRAHVMQQLEKAEVCDEAARKRWYLSFIVIGGGYSGVEAAGEINDLVRGSRRFFQNSVYLFKLPSWSRRIKAGFDWAWELFFARDLAHLKTDQSERVAGAHYASGDYIFRQGDPGTSFYVIEKGEVEVFRRVEGKNSDEVLAVLGPGDFFGEMALIDNQPRSASIRARCPVEVVVIGKNVFSQISSSLKPLHHLLAKTMNRRATSAWQRLPIAYEILEREPLSSFIEPLSHAYLRPESTLKQAVTLFNENTSSFCCVVDEQQCLQGIVTRTDLFRASELGAHRHTTVRDFMVAPITVTRNDSSLMAAATLRDHELKSLPVIESQTSRRLIGYVRAEKMFMRVLQKLPADQRL